MLSTSSISSKKRTTTRKITDKTGKQKNARRNCQKIKEDSNKHEAHLLNTKRRLQADELYRKRNHARAKQRWEDEQYKEENRARATVSTPKRLAENEHYRKINIKRATARHKKKLQESESYRQQQSVRSTAHKKKKLTQSEEYRKQHQNRVTANRRQKLHENQSYRQVHQMRLTKYMTSRLQNDKQYKETINAKARLRMKVKYKKHICPASHTNSNITQQQATCWKKQMVSTAALLDSQNETSGSCEKPAEITNTAENNAK